ncbi:GNAT family N-acetyltransferase [Achromobacter spanius]|uniref:GNAT family N-acetyltransferase n=1 Tax=Achromobacter spanius TaxID=217203 RepID=UPI0009F850BE|nr:GNAT family protein [Achromobacter spanius]
MEIASLPVPGALHVSLRSLQLLDAEAWSAYLSKPGVIEHTSWRDVSATALAALIQEYAKKQDVLRWAIVDTSATLMGTVGLNELALSHGRAELAYDLDPEHRGRGLATQASHAVMQWAHGMLGLRRIQATVLDTNKSSIAVLERLGMQREGLLRSYRKVRGEPRDFWMYSVVYPR